VVGVTTRPRLALPVAALVLVLTAGCNGNGDASPPDESAGGDATTSSTPSPSESPSPTVEPASGPEMVPDEGGARMRAPKAYTLMPRSLNTAVSAEDPQARGFITLSVLPSAREGDLDELARIGMKRFDGKPTRLPDVEIQGVTFYHLAGENAVGLHQDHYSAAYENKLATLQFNFFASEFSTPQRQKIIDSVLATFAWG
jgi:hypothetical protein